MKRWQAPRDPRVPGFVIIAMLLLIGVGVGVWQATRVLRQPIDTWPISLASFGIVLALLLGLAAAVALLLRAAYHASLEYQLDRNGLYVVHSGSRYTIPLDRMVTIERAEQIDRADRAALSFGRGALATSLVIVTQLRSYRLAAVERDALLQAIVERRRLGIIQPQREGVTYANQHLSDFYGRGSVQYLLAAAVALNLVLWAVLAWRYAVLPDTLPIRFDPLGGTAGTRARSFTLLLPLGSSGVVIGNTLLALLAARRSWLSADLLLFGAVLIQILVLVALGFIVTIAGSGI